MAFSPGQGTVINVSTVSASGAVTPDAPSLQLIAVGSVPVFVRWGAGPQTAVATDYPVIPNVPVVISKSSGTGTVAAICASGTATLYAIPGFAG